MFIKRIKLKQKSFIKSYLSEYFYLINYLCIVHEKKKNELRLITELNSFNFQTNWKFNFNFYNRFIIYAIFSLNIKILNFLEFFRICKKKKLFL